MKKFLLAGILSMLTSAILAQNINPNNLKASLVSTSETKIEGKTATRVAIDTSVKAFDEPSFAKLTNTNFHDGTIEVNVFSKFQQNAPDWARGFIGIAFRINDDNSKFECIYIRPSNGRVDDQVRRNHSTQYFSFPDHKFSDFRKTDPEKYESYADMGMNEWIKMKIIVLGSSAKLFINDSKQPCLVVTDLKYGADMSGSVGLWVGNWTDGYFSDLKITK